MQLPTVADTAARMAATAARALLRIGDPCPSCGTPRCRTGVGATCQECEARSIAHSRTTPRPVPVRAYDAGLVALRALRLGNTFTATLEALGTWAESVRRGTFRAPTLADNVAPESRRRRMLSHTAAEARPRLIECVLTLPDIIIPAACPVCGEAFDLARAEGKGYRPDVPTLDRIENHLGYLPGNVLVMCLRCNSAKSSASLCELADMGTEARRTLCGEAITLPRGARVDYDPRPALIAAEIAKAPPSQREELWRAAADMMAAAEVAPPPAPAAEVAPPPVGDLAAVGAFDRAYDRATGEYIGLVIAHIDIDGAPGIRCRSGKIGVALERIADRIQADCYVVPPIGKHGKNMRRGVSRQ